MLLQVSAAHAGVGHGGHGVLGGCHGGKVVFMVERRFQLKESWKNKKSPFTTAHRLFRHYPKGFRVLDPPALCDIGLWGALSPIILY